MSKYGLVPARAASAGLSGSALQVLIVICAYADRKTHQAYPSIRTIERDSGLHRRTVHRAIDELSAAGLLTVERRRTPAGDADANLYTVMMGKPAEVVAAAPPPPSDGDATTVVANEYPEVVAPRPPEHSSLTNHLTRARAHAPEGRGQSRVATLPEAGGDVLAEARIRAFRKNGVWQPDWGPPPAEPAEAAA